MSHGKETKYPGVTYVMTRRLTGFGEERMYYTGTAGEDVALKRHSSLSGENRKG